MAFKNNKANKILEAKRSIKNKKSISEREKVSTVNESGLESKEHLASVMLPLLVTYSWSVLIWYESKSNA